MGSSQVSPRSSGHSSVGKWIGTKAPSGRRRFVRETALVTAATADGAASAAADAIKATAIVGGTAWAAAGAGGAAAIVGRTASAAAAVRFEFGTTTGVTASC